MKPYVPGFPYFSLAKSNPWTSSSNWSSSSTLVPSPKISISEMKKSCEIL